MTEHNKGKEALRDQLNQSETRKHHFFGRQSSTDEVTRLKEKMLKEEAKEADKIRKLTEETARKQQEREDKLKKKEEMEQKKRDLESEKSLKKLEDERRKAFEDEEKKRLKEEKERQKHELKRTNSKESSEKGHSSLLSRIRSASSKDSKDSTNQLTSSSSSTPATPPMLSTPTVFSPPSSGTSNNTVTPKQQLLPNNSLKQNRDRSNSSPASNGLRRLGATFFDQSQLPNFSNLPNMPDLPNMDNLDFSCPNLPSLPDVNFSIPSLNLRLPNNFGAPSIPPLPKPSLDLPAVNRLRTESDPGVPLKQLALSSSSNSSDDDEVPPSLYIGHEVTQDDLDKLPLTNADEPPPLDPSLAPSDGMGGITEMELNNSSDATTNEASHQQLTQRPAEDTPTSTPSQTAQPNKQLEQEPLTVLKGQELGWCSWCGQLGPQNLLKRNIPGRNEYSCNDCCKNTIHCLKCRDGFAKRFPRYDDKLCAVCDKSFPSWENAKPPLLEGYCSWCYYPSKHSLHQKNLVRRNIYSCETCHKNTVPCRKCKQAFGKARGESGESNCSKCKGKIQDWTDREKNLQLVSRQAWCSWCFENTRHEIEKDNVVFRTAYTCTSCQMKTLKCMKCETGMTKGGFSWDDNFCASCAVLKKFDWATIKARKDAVLMKPRVVEEVIAELKRDSEYKRKALKVGCIRPFLIMVAMPPVFRFQIASCLGWALFTEQCFGDPHAEAWNILDRTQQGMRFRCSSAYEKINVLGIHATWYDMLIRTADIGFQYALPPKIVAGSREQRKGRNSADPFLARIEEQYLVLLSYLMRANMTAKEREDTARSMEGKEAIIIQRRMFENCGVTRKEVVQYGYKVTNKIQSQFGIEAQIKQLAISHGSALVGNVTSQLGIASSASGSAASAVTSTAMPQLIASTVPQLAGVVGSVAGLSAVLAAQMALLSSPLFVLGFVGLAKTGFQMLFGSSEGRLFVPVTMILNQKLLLAIEGIKIEEYY